MIKALIVDDEYPAREELRYHLKKFDNIKIIGEAATLEEAESLINEVSYDLIFLDINFSVSNGIDFGMRLQNSDHSPFIVYVTAYDTYAVKAFDTNAIAYILKPIDELLFSQTLSRVISKISENKPTTKPKAMNPLGKLSAELNGRTIMVDIQDIFYSYADQNYVFFKRINDSVITRHTLNQLEIQLVPFHFFRANRSQLVNLKHIKEITPFYNGSCDLIMNDPSHSVISVSRRQSKLLKDLLNL